MKSNKSRTSSHELIIKDTDLRTIKMDPKAVSQPHSPSGSNSFEKPLILNNSEDDITESYTLGKT
jgi:hypothetical protein